MQSGPLAFSESGARGVPVVLLHALGSTAATWDGAAARLPDRHLLALDLRGHGGSPWTATYSLDLMRDDVLGFLDDHGFERVDLVGHSMGGAVAVRIAQHAPRRVRRLVVEDTPPPPDEAKPASPVQQPAEPLPFDWRLIEPIMAELRSPDPAWWERLAAVRASTLLISGGPTSHVSPDALERVCRIIPDCRLVTVPGAGHRVHATEPDGFWSVVAPFLGTAP